MVSTTSTTKLNPPRLRKAFVLLRCSEEGTHDNCLRMRDLLVKNVHNVTQAYTTKRMVDDVAYCVAGRALVNANELSKFENKLASLRSNPPNVVSVEQALVRLSA